jgi:hypothetical protein
MAAAATAAMELSIDGVSDGTSTGLSINTSTGLSINSVSAGTDEADADRLLAESLEALLSTAHYRYPFRLGGTTARDGQSKGTETQMAKHPNPSMVVARMNDV